MKRHGAVFEGDAHDDEGKTEHEPKVARTDLAHGDRELIELQRAGDAVDDGESIQQGAGSDCPEHEVLHRGLGRDARFAIERHHRVERERQQLEAEINRHEIAGRGHDHDAEQCDQAQNEILAFEEAAALQILARIHERDGDRAVREQLERIAHRIGDEQTVERPDACVDAIARRYERGAGERRERQHIRDPAISVAQENVDQQDDADRGQHENLGCDCLKTEVGQR
jgi:hypothetical protein